MISSALVVLSPVGCLWIIAVVCSSKTDLPIVYHYTDSLVPFLFIPKFETSSPLCLHRPVGSDLVGNSADLLVLQLILTSGN